MIRFKVNKFNSNTIIILLLTVILFFSCGQYLYNNACINSPEASIIVYHDIVSDNSDYNPEDNVRSLKDFENDLKYIRNKFGVITLDELKKHIDNRIRLHSHSIIITFDDKIPSDDAINLLIKYSIKTTVFLATSKINEDSWNKIRNYNNYLTYDNDKLFYFESHTHNHIDLDKASDQELYDELNLSKKTIYNNLGYSVRYLALPWALGAGNQKIIFTAKKLGYKGIRTLISMNEDLYSTDMFCLKAFNIQNKTEIKSIIY